MIGLMNWLNWWQRPSSFLRSPHFALLLFFVALLPRLAAVGQYITPDELNWVHRSVRFHQALGSGQWEETLTTGHPGVITTWLGAAGTQIQLWLRPSDAATYDWITHLAWLAPENTAAFPKLATFLSAGRMMVALVNSLGLIAIWGLARRLVRAGVAAGFALLLAVDPFVAGLSGLLHVDGLMTTFVTISLLALVVGLQDMDWRFTAVSGAAAGCAILAKSAALTLLPFVASIFLFSLFIWRKRWQRLIWLGLIWLLVMVAIQFLLLPALWDSPIAVYQTIVNTILHETEEVLPNTFFLGFYKQAHGQAFYPVALFYRLNPVVFGGLLLGGWFGLRRKWSAGWWQRPLPWLAIIWPVFFIIVLSLATKKYDRYLLPAVPMLLLLSVAGWGMLIKNRPPWRRNVTIGSLAVALIYLGTAVPYLLNAYNPVADLLMPTEKVMPMGWGEAVSASAQWLAEQPDADGKTAVAGIAPAFASFFPGKTEVSNSQNRQRADYAIETLAGYQAIDFRIVPIPGRQYRLVHTIHYDGQDQAWIYANDNPVQSDILWQPQTAQFGDAIQLLAAATAVQDDQLDVLVRWQLAQSVNGRFNVQIRLLDEYGQLWSQLEMPLLNEVYFYPGHWQPDEQPIFSYPLPLPPGLPPANYRVELSLFAAETGAQLPVVAEDGRFAGVVQPLPEVEISPPSLLQTAPLSLTATPLPLLDGNLLFLGQANLPESVLTAGTFSLDSFWQSTAVLPENLHLKFFADDTLLSRLPLSRFDSGLWWAGQVIHEKHLISIPAALPAGDYDLQLEVVDGDGRSLDSPLIDLGTITVVSPDRLFTLPNDIGQSLALQFGDLAHLRGYTLLTPSAAPGEPVHLALYWQVNGQSDEILSTFVHLVGPDGRTVVQGDQWPGGLPSTTWAEGQVIIDEYAIQLPDEAPPGSYQIVLGLYSPARGTRQPIFAEDGQPLPNDQFALPLEVVAR